MEANIRVYTVRGGTESRNLVSRHLVVSDRNDEPETGATHPFPDDNFPRLVIGVLESVKNSCPGLRGKLREKTHLWSDGQIKKGWCVLLSLSLFLCGVYRPNL